MPLESILIRHLEDLFELHRIQAAAAFRVTRNGDLAIDEEAEDLLIEIQESIKKRKRGRPVRLELTRHCDPELREFLVDMLRVEEPDIYEETGPLDLTFCFRLSSLDDSLRLAPIEPAPPLILPAGTIPLRRSGSGTASSIIHMKASTRW